MKKIHVYIVLLTTLLGMNACSQASDTSYEVATWQGFKQAAVTYTFDDQCPNQFAVALPLFDEYGFKLTLYPVVNWGLDWEKVKSAAANGHEIGSHTMTHPYLDSLSIAAQDEELSRSKAIISENSGTDCNTIAYPYCHLGDSATISKYYIAGRICDQAIVPKTPADYYNIPSIVCGNQGSVNSLADFQNRFTAAAESTGWCVLLIHGIDDDGGYSPLPSEVLRQSVEYLAQNKDTYWVATFKEALLYSKERDAVSIQETLHQRSEIRLEITDHLDNSVYNYPLTIRRPLPMGWTNAEVKQNGTVAPSKIVTVNQIKSIEFEAVPDGGSVSIERV
jgi:oligosaccharide reducing-end xylanase